MLCQTSSRDTPAPWTLPRPNPATQPHARQANAAKDKALAEVQALKLQAEREHASFEEEFRQLTQIIEDDRRRARPLGG
jgi:hypothetical protein